MTSTIIPQGHLFGQSHKAARQLFNFLDWLLFPVDFLATPRILLRNWEYVFAESPISCKWHPWRLWYGPIICCLSTKNYVLWAFLQNDWPFMGALPGFSPAFWSSFQPSSAFLTDEPLQDEHAFFCQLTTIEINEWLMVERQWSVFSRFLSRSLDRISQRHGLADQCWFYRFRGPSLQIRVNHLSPLYASDSLTMRKSTNYHPSTISPFYRPLYHWCYSTGTLRRHPLGMAMCSTIAELIICGYWAHSRLRSTKLFNWFKCLQAADARSELCWLL